jgi:thiol-disulfide isomerase/thioredoxin
MKTVIYSLLMIVSSSIYAQQKNVHRLKIGDSVPNLSLNYSVGDKKENVTLKSMRGKLIILDFWNIWCSSCITNMPEMERLQKAFPEKVKIFLVTNNSQKQIDEQFKKIAERTKGAEAAVNIPKGLASIVSDTSLHQLFPHNAVPHHIWIDPLGVVKFITDGTNATMANVEAFLEGQDLKLTVKRDTGKFEHNLPLYREGGGRQLDRLQSYSMIYKESGEFQNARIAQQTDSSTSTYRYRCLNFTLLNLFLQPYRSSYAGIFSNKNRRIIMVRDSGLLSWPDDQSKNSLWREKYLHSYELAIPLQNKNMRDSFMLGDLNKLLPYSIKVEKRMVECLALVIKDKNGKFASASNASVKWPATKKGSVEMINGSVKDLIVGGLSSLNSILITPIIDETAYHGKMNIKLSTRTDLEQIKRELKEYGLELVNKKSVIDMLVIRDRD